MPYRMYIVRGWPVRRQVLRSARGARVATPDRHRSARRAAVARGAPVCVRYGSTPRCSDRCVLRLSSGARRGCGKYERCPGGLAPIRRSAQQRQRPFEDLPKTRSQVVGWGGDACASLDARGVAALVESGSCSQGLKCVCLFKMGICIMCTDRILKRYSRGYPYVATHGRYSQLYRSARDAAPHCAGPLGERRRRVRLRSVAFIILIMRILTGSICRRYGALVLARAVLRGAHVLRALTLCSCALGAGGCVGTL